jgi:hypothetical protein
MRLGSIDLDILDLLTRRVRLATEEQLVELSGNSRGVCRRLVAAGLLHRAVIVAAVPELTGPLATWRPGQLPPRFAALAWKLEKRRRETPSRRTPIFWASQAAVRVVGGIGGHIRQPVQVEHDLGTTATYLRRHQLCPESTSLWVSEDLCRLFQSQRRKIPDAQLMSPEGVAELAIEFGGAYSASRLRTFHHSSSLQNLPWEIW